MTGSPATKLGRKSDENPLLASAIMFRVTLSCSSLLLPIAIAFAVKIASAILIVVNDSHDYQNCHDRCYVAMAQVYMIPVSASSTVLFLKKCKY